MISYIYFAPILALALGIVALFVDAKNLEERKNQILTSLVIFLQIAICILAIYSSYAEAEKAKAQEERFNELTESLGEVVVLLEKETEEITQEPIVAETVSEGETIFAYYGLQNYDGTWQHRYFDRTQKPVAGTPQVGDVVVATEYVNARDGYIEFSSEEGWTNKPVIGSISPGDKVKILEVKRILGNYVWIQGEQVE